MPKMFKKRTQKAGLPPGSLIHVGERKSEETKITLIEYSARGFSEREIAAPADLGEPGQDARLRWINVTGLHEVEAIGELGRMFGLNKLLVEDILNTGQRPKINDYDSYIYVALLSARCGADADIMTEQVSMVVGDTYVLTFEEGVGDLFEPARDRLRHAQGNTRGRGADYLAYALVDLIVDDYFITLEKLADKLDNLEQELVADGRRETLTDIYRMKREMLYMHRIAWPARDVISTLERGASSLISDDTRFYLRDVYDHIVQILDTIESFRDIVSSMIEIQLTLSSNRMNEVMKVLTIIATIFLPLTLVAGIYGMNFRYFPELHWRWGYPAVLAFMALIALGMLAYFRRRKWL